MAVEAVAVAPSMAQDVNYGVELAEDGYAWRLLAGFRGELYRCLTRRGDALFGLADAVLCGPGRVSDLARLSLAPESGRGHGGVYDGVNAGRMDVGRLRGSLAGGALPRWAERRIRVRVR